MVVLFCFGIVIAYYVRVLVPALPYKTVSSSAVTVWQVLSRKGLLSETEWCRDARQVMSKVGRAVKGGQGLEMWQEDS